MLTKEWMNLVDVRKSFIYACNAMHLYSYVCLSYVTHVVANIDCCMIATTSLAG